MKLVVIALSLVAAGFAAAAGCTGRDQEPAAAERGAGLEESLLETEGDTDLDAFARRAQWIDEYGALAGGCVDRVDDRDGRRALFHGCYDWHSSVHAHWAVLRMDRVGAGGHRELARKIDDRLAEAEVARVAAELGAEPSYEMPYGRAWLLRLVSEQIAWAQARRLEPSTELRRLGDDTAAALVARFAVAPPSSRRGDYQSDAWTLAQVLSYARARGDEATAQKIVDLVRSAFERDPVIWAETNDHDPSAFFSAFWSSAHVIALANDPERTLALVKPELLPDDALTPLADPGTASDVHHLGINWSRAWAIKAVARRAQRALGASHPTARRLVAAYHAHVRAGRERHLRYRGDYYAYDHWVPQFAIYAITDEE